MRRQESGPTDAALELNNGHNVASGGVSCILEIRTDTRFHDPSAGLGRTSAAGPGGPLSSYALLPNRGPEVHDGPGTWTEKQIKGLKSRHKTQTNRFLHFSVQDDFSLKLRWQVIQQYWLWRSVWNQIIRFLCWPLFSCPTLGLHPSVFLSDKMRKCWQRTIKQRIWALSVWFYRISLVDTQNMVLVEISIHPSIQVSLSDNKRQR